MNIGLIFSGLAALALTSCTDISKPDQYGNTYDLTWGFDDGYPKAGFTYATSDRHHGIQIEYFAPDGRVFLWYPTNTRSLPGRWRRNKWGDVCFAYAGRTYNPATGKVSQDMEEICHRNYQLSGKISRVAGDPFNLSSGRVPDFVLKKCRLPSPMQLQTSFWSCRPR